MGVDLIPFMFDWHEKGHTSSIAVCFSERKKLRVCALAPRKCSWVKPFIPILCISFLSHSYLLRLFLCCLFRTTLQRHSDVAHTQITCGEWKRENSLAFKSSVIHCIIFSITVSLFLSSFTLSLSASLFLLCTTVPKSKLFICQFNCSLLDLNQLQLLSGRTSLALKPSP